MLATRPASPEGASRAQPEELSAAASQEEKRIPGVQDNTLLEERKPLLDLDDVERLESELAACFDAPPPPPLNIEIQREEVTATVSEWTPAAEPRYLDNRYVAPRAPSLSTVVRGDEQQQQQQQQQATRVSDYSSLYSPPTNLTTSASRQALYPALVPTAPSADVARTHSRGRVHQSTTGQAVDRGAAAAAGRAIGATATAEIDPAVASGVIGLGGSMAAAEARERGGAAAGAAAAAVAAKAGEAPVQVVEELLSENERLRLIIQDMSEELDRVTFQLNEGAEAVVREEPAVANDAAQERAPASRTEEAVASSSATNFMNRYPGAQAEAMRRRREAGGGQSEQQQHQQEERGNQDQTLRRGIFVHFKCDNCPQWLKVPGHAQLVYCPTCSHTSQMTSSSTIYFPQNNEIRQADGSGSAAGGGAASSSAAAADAGEDVGWLGYIKSVLAS